MAYELIILSKAWFHSQVSLKSLEILQQIINKGYSKVMDRYGIILTNRIGEAGSLLQALQFSPEKEFTLMILLGSRETFQEIEARHGYKRHFNGVTFPVSASRDSDIPKGLESEFGPLERANIKNIILSPNENLESEILDRVLSTVAFKSYEDEYSPQSDDIKDYEVTAFTSFMYNCGTQLLEYIIEDSCSLFVQSSEINTVRLHAVVIKEHDLVSFYEKRCRFVRSPNADAVVTLNSQESVDFGVEHSKDFHLSFLHRDVVVNRR